MLFLLGNKGNDPSVSSAASCSSFTLFSCVSCLSWFLSWATLGKPPEGKTANLRHWALRLCVEIVSTAAAATLNAKTPRREDAKEDRRAIKRDRSNYP